MKEPDDRQETAAHEQRAMLLGLGFDCEDGQKRITVGKNFLLAGGSEPTHELMQEKAIKFNEELGRRKKRLEDISRGEFNDIAESIDLPERP